MPKTLEMIFGASIAVLMLTQPVAAQDLEDLMPGAVRIFAHPSQGSPRTGTGFIVRATPDVVYIVTAAHVVEGDPQPEVEFFTKRDVPVRAAVKGAERGDDQRGLALLSVAGKDNIPAGIVVLPLASDNLTIARAEEVAVIGLPREARDWAIIYGRFISRTGRDVTLDINIDEGASGAPVLKSRSVIGLVQGFGRSYVRGNPIESVRSYLKGFGVEPQATSTFSFSSAPRPPSASSEPMASPAPPGTKTGRDGAPMVFIPAGKFWMGSPEGEGDDNERPRHQVTLDSFYLDKYEVTNQQFQEFIKATNYRTTAEQDGSAYGYTTKGNWENINGANWKKPEGDQTVFTSGRDSHPVVSISWNDAKAYCQWAGKRLPSEAEWEYAARAGTQTKYWWGDGNPGSRKVGNFADETAKRQFPDWTIMEGYDDGYGRTAPVGSFEANLWGLHDMTGNVWEWVADWFAKDYYSQSQSPVKNPQGPVTGEYRVLRGGSWSYDPWVLRSAVRVRGTPSLRDSGLGVRCAADAP